MSRLLRFSESDTGAPEAVRAVASERVPCDIAMLQRAKGEARIGVARAADGSHRVTQLRQSGAAKILAPRNHLDGAFEAVLLNSAGGLAGGDRLRWQIEAGPGATLRATTQAAERVYRSPRGDARVDTRLRVEAGATLEWLPQETILFDASRLTRTLDIELSENAALLAVEAVVFGRRAHGEQVRTGALRDRWRVRRGGRLIHADDVRIEGDIAALLDRPGTLGGAQAFATVMLAGPNRVPIDDVRAMLPGGVEAGASALPDVTLVRMAAPHGDILRPALAAFLVALRGIPLPRVWQV